MVRAPTVRTTDATVTVRWVLAHEPPAVFEEASEVFAQRLAEHSDGEMVVDLYDAERFARLKGGPVSRAELVRSVVRGDVEMAHCYVSALGAVCDALWAVELPFLFRDYAHAERVFEGPVGARLLDALAPAGLRGLSFAYSGGWRIVPTKGRTLRELADFDGLRVRTSGNPVPEAVHRALGARPIGADLDQIVGLAAQDRIDGCEITWVRFQAAGLHEVFDTVNETRHSLFTTAMVVNEAWFQSLTPVHQQALVAAAREACRVERQTSIDEERVTREALSSTHTVVQMAPQVRAAFAARAQEATGTLVDRFGAELVDAIRQS